jgi:beta-galactosidase
MNILKSHLALIAAFLTLSVGPTLMAAEPEKSPAPREKLSLDRGWRFHLGDIPFPVVTGHDPSYANAKAGKAWGAAAPDYDDSEWRELNLPHDWAVEGPFDEKANLSQGYRPRGIGWYRRQFKLDPADRGRYLELQFDGVATHCEVWFNGSVVARNWCGYTSFYIDLTPYAQFGDSLNTIAVRVDADAMEGWWYEGAGIYRHTWLVKRDPVHIVTDGVYANPIRAADGSWTVPVEATLNNSGAAGADVEVAVSVSDPAGKEVAHGRVRVSVAALDETVARLSLPVAAPQLWSVDQPVLYQVHTKVINSVLDEATTASGAVLDEATTTCGFRTIRFDADKGFLLNDQPLKIHGTCNHQDHAGVGVAVPDSLWDFRVRKLKEMGSNAYRCAHNPPAAEFLAACDRQGMLVMDENRNFNTSPEYVRQLQWLVRRDRNHPSVILWSVFNEEPFQGTEQGYQMVRRMAAEVKKLDTTRPVTAAQSGGNLNPVNASQAADVAGFNYQQGQYDKFHAENPTRPMTSSEDTSAYMTRDEYVDDANRHIRSSYDTDAAPWGATHHAAWAQIAERPFVAGDFVWTGFDYRGEPTPFKWPSAGSFFGCMDLCGFPKSAFYIHQAGWIETRPILHLIPHWNWPDKVGQLVKVMAITNADKVALSLNGQSIGEQTVDKYHFATWEVPYAPGKLEAVATKQGQEVARTSVETTGVPAALQLTPDRSALAGDGWDAQPVTVAALDAQGRLISTANFPVEFELTGPGEIIGLGNGDPNSHEPEKGNQRSIFNGLAQVIVQSQPGKTGPLVLRAKAPGLTPATVTIDVVAAPVPPFVPVLQGPVVTLGKWRMSPVSAAAPDPNQEIPDNDQNSWTQIQPGKPQPLAGGNFAVFRLKFTPRAGLRHAGGTLTFRSLAGRAEVWMDKRLLGKKDGFEDGPFAVPFPPGEGERTVSVLIESQPGQPAGFGGPVTVEP